MKNTLKIALLLIGLLLTGYGIYTLFFPCISMAAGVKEAPLVTDNVQSVAMIGLGLLFLLSGISFKRRK